MAHTNRYLLTRFLLKGALLTFFAAFQWRRGFASTVGMLFCLATLLDSGLAVLGKEPFRAPGFTYWDEAAVFLLKGALTGLTLI